MTKRQFIKAGLLWLPTVASGATIYLPNRRKSFQPASGGGDCSTVFFQHDVTMDDWADMTAYYVGVAFWTPTGNASVCAVEFDIKLTGSVNFIAQIWTQGAGWELATKQGSDSQAQAGTGSRATHKFTYASTVSISSGTQYALVVKRQDGLEAQNLFPYQGGDSATMSTMRWDGSGEAIGWSTRDPRFKVYT